MVEIESNNIGGVKLPDSATISAMTIEEQLEGRDSRLLVLESSVREVQNSMQIWSNIIQDGLADLSMQVKAAMQGCRVRRLHVESELEDDSSISERLSKVEQQMQRLQTRVRADLEGGARIVKLEREMQGLQTNMQEIQDKCLQCLQGLQGSVDELRGCVNVGVKNGPEFERSRSPSQLPHPQRVHRLPQPQLQVQHQPKAYSALLPPRPLVTTPFQPHTGVVEKNTKMLSVTRVVEGMLSPRLLHRTGRHVALPHASDAVQESLVRASLSTR